MDLSAKVRLQNFMAEHPHYAKKSLGQHFLVNDLVIHKMLDALAQFNPQHVVEVGPGPGALTDLLRTRYDSMLTLIEFDTALASVWKGRGATIHEADALRFDWSTFRDLPERVLISNLPYQISSSIVIERCLDEIPFKGMILMFQKEVADRIRAKISTVDYGLLTVLAQSFWKIELLAGLGRADFLPPPKVNSQVLVFRSVPLSPFYSSTKNREKYLKFIKAAFQQRRKFLKSNLGAMFKKEAIERAFAILKIDLNSRAEEISVALFQELFETLVAQP